MTYLGIYKDLADNTWKVKQTAGNYNTYADKDATLNDLKNDGHSFSNIAVVELHTFTTNIAWDEEPIPTP